MPQPLPNPQDLADRLLGGYESRNLTREGRPCLLWAEPPSRNRNRRFCHLIAETTASSPPEWGSILLGAYTSEAAPGRTIPSVHLDRMSFGAGHLSIYTGGLCGHPGLERVIGYLAAEECVSRGWRPVDPEVASFVAAATAIVLPGATRLLDEALDASGIAPLSIRTLRALRPMLHPGSALLDGILGRDPQRVDDADIAGLVARCERDPLLTELLWTRSASPEAIAGLAQPGPGGLIALCDAIAPGLNATRIDRLRGIGLSALPYDADGSNEGLARLIAECPLDWLRPDPQALGAMLGIAGPYLSLAQMRGADPVRLLAPAKGDWGAFGARCRSAAGLGDTDPLGESLRSAGTEATDPVLHMATHVMLPLLARGELPDDGMPDQWLTRCLAAARLLLYADKGMPAVLETSALWHRRAEAIAARTPSGATDSWEPACAPFTASNGVVVRALSSAMDLVEEGSAGADADGIPGLGHCVASYRTLAKTGRSHILSLRAAGPVPLRLSTAEVKVDAFGRADVAQHKGLRNGPAPAEAVRALGEFVTRVRMTPPRPDDDRPAGGRIEAECGYDWRNDDLVRLAAMAYAEFLPRHLRSCDLDAIAEHAGFPVPVPAPAP